MPLETNISRGQTCPTNIALPACFAQKKGAALGEWQLQWVAQRWASPQPGEATHKALRETLLQEDRRWQLLSHGMASKMDRNNALRSHPESRQTLQLRVNIYLINNLQNLTDLIYVRSANLLNILHIFLFTMSYIKISTVLK